MDRVEVLWLSTAQRHPVGIVRAFDQIEKCYKFYIGSCSGVGLDEDIKEIIDWGQKFYNLDFLLDFIKAGDPHV